MGIVDEPILQVATMIEKMVAITAMELLLALNSDKFPRQKMLKKPLFLISKTENIINQAVDQLTPAQKIVLLSIKRKH